MKSILIELEDEVAAKLEQVAPGRTRQRSEFIRRAIRRALWDLDEQRQPDAGPAYVDRAAWEPRAAPSRRRARR